MPRNIGESILRLFNSIISLMNTENSVAIISFYSLALLFTSLFFFPKDFQMPTLMQLIPLMSLGVMGSLGH